VVYDRKLVGRPNGWVTSYQVTFGEIGLGEKAMASDYLADEIRNLREAIEAQTAGLMSMLGTVAAQNAMLKEILAACTAEPENSPLADLLMQMNASLRRIEDAMMHRAQ
jgi:hypothetical protein